MKLSSWWEHQQRNNERNIAHFSYGQIYAGWVAGLVVPVLMVAAGAERLLLALGLICGLVSTVIWGVCLSWKRQLDQRAGGEP